MSRLIPGATYIYERADGVTYAREAGAHPSTRIEIGRDYKVDTFMGMPVHQLAEIAEWIHTSEDDPVMAEMLDKVRTYHSLKKQY